MASAATPDTILLSNHRPSAASELQHCACGARMKEPRLLNCLHVLGTCCLQLLKVDEKSVVVCTQCEHATPVPEHKLQLLPSPLFLFKLQPERRSKQKQKIGCEQCKTDPMDAVVLCGPCNSFICAEHKALHEKFPFLQDHYFNDIDKKSTQCVCRKHGLLTHLYCKECKLVVCALCKPCSKTDYRYQAHRSINLYQVVAPLEPAIRTKLEALSLPLDTPGNTPQHGQGGLDQMPQVRKALDYVEKHIAVYLNQKEFFRSRAEQILEAGTAEEKILLHSALPVPKPSPLIVKCDDIDALISYVPGDGDLSARVQTKPLTKEQWWDKVKVNSFILSKDKNNIYRIATVDKQQKRCDVYHVGYAPVGSGGKSWNEQQLVDYDLLVNDVCITV